MKTESKRVECVTEERSPDFVENWNNNILRKPISEFPLNCAFYCMAVSFDSAPVESGMEPCWDECVSCEDGIDLPGKAGNWFDMKVFVPTAPLELIRTSKKWQRDLEQLDLEDPLPSGKTNWATIREVHVILKRVLTILEATVNDVSNKYELCRSSTNLNSDDDDEYYLEESNDIDLYERLYNSFEEVSSVALERCFQALNLIANCIVESQDITEYAPIPLRNASLDLVDIYNRIWRVQEILIFSKERTIESTRRNAQEEKAFKCACGLIEAVSGYVISIQSQALHSGFMQQDEAETPKEETSVLECLQQSWIWLNKLSKQVAVSCPRKKQKLFVYLLETFINAAGELSQHQKLLSFLYDENCKDHMATACSCQKILLHSLMQLFKNAKKAGLEFKKEGLVAAFDFAQNTDASRMSSITLTLLLSLISEQGGTTILESKHFSETLQRSREELMYFAQPCMAVIERLVIEVSH